jgi:iduronate 2-sulfatase
MMIKTRLSFIALSLILITAMNHGCSPTQSDERRPGKLNVLFIVADDLGTSLSCYGDALVRSPNIDRLAGRGARFDRAYSQFSLCNPSRASFLSGLRPDTSGVLRNAVDPRSLPALKDAVFLPEHFRGLGYFTARVGKFTHDKFQDSVTWDVSENAGQLEEDSDTKGKLPPECSGYWCATNNKDEDEPDGLVARRVAQLLKENRNKSFFIAAGFSKPHSPWIAPKKYFEQYPLENMPASQVAEGEEGSGEDGRQARAAYYACVSFIDAQVGVILDALEKLGLIDSTVIVFTSDHGYHMGEHGGIWDKKTLYDQAVRVPLIVAAPGRRAGVTSSQFVELVDLYPTLTELCNLPTPAGMEGISFTPLLEDPARPWKKAVFSFAIKSKRSPLQHSVRTARYSYIEQIDGREPELYDLESDPGEMTNLAGDPKQAKTIANMKQMLKEGWRAALPPGKR